MRQSNGALLKHRPSKLLVKGGSRDVPNWYFGDILNDYFEDVL
jgi:hypothetical protein